MPIKKKRKRKSKKQNTRKQLSSKKTQQKYRDAKCVFIWGKNGTGKSTFAKKICDGIGERTLVVTYSGAPRIWKPLKKIDPKNSSDMGSFDGYRQLYYHWFMENTWKYIFQNFQKGTLLLDDCRGYLPSNIQNPKMVYFKRLLMDFRHRELDIIVIGHSSREIPNGIWPNVSDIFVGATNQQVGQKPISGIKQLEQLQNKVNAIYNKEEAKGGTSKYGLFYRFQVQ